MRLCFPFSNYPLILFIRVLQVASQSAIQVALVADVASFPRVSTVLSDAIKNVTIGNFTLFSNSSTSYTDTCGTGVNEGKGAYEVCEYFYKYNISSVFGPTCYKDLQMSARLTSEWNILQFNFWTDHPSDQLDNTVVQMTTRSIVNVATNIIAALSALNWDKIVLFRCDKCYDDPNMGEERIDYMSTYLKNHGVLILSERSFTPTDSVSTIVAQLNETKHLGRIFVPITGGDLQSHSTFLQAASEVGITWGDYAVVTVISSYNANGLQLPSAAVQQYYQNIIVIVNENYNSATASSFATRVGVSNTDDLATYLQLYESIFLYNQLVQYVQTPTNGRNLLAGYKNSLISGPFGQYYLDSLNNRICPYSVYYLDSSMNLLPIANITLQQTHCSSGVQSPCAQLTSSFISIPNITIPQDMPSCGFEGENCEQTSTVLIIVGIVAGLAVISILFFVYRRVKGNEIRDMPWSLPFHTFQFIDVNKTSTRDDNGDSSFHSLQLLQEMGSNPSTGINGSANIVAEEQPKKRERGRKIPMPPRSRLATVNNNFALVYSYPFVEKRASFTREEISLFYMLKQVVHDNLNSFLGCSYDSPTLLVAWTMCFKGTLTNVLQTQAEQAAITGETSLAHNFRGAFVRDILRGLEFLHQSPIGYHGALTPNNCLVDSHWILKLSGFGMSKMINRWKHKRTIATMDREILIRNSELHYYAPEVRGFWREVHYSGKTEAAILPSAMGINSDIYSFGMILYEILYQKKFVDLKDDKPLEIDEDYSLSDQPNELFSFEAESKIPSMIEVPESADVHADLRTNMMKCWDRDADRRPRLLLLRRITDSTLKMTGSLVDQMMRNLEQYTNNLENLVTERTAQLEEEQKTAENLLLELLPRSVADELRMGRQVEPKEFKHATILYSDIVGFTSLCSESQPMEVVALLSGIFQAFDRIISHHNAYKVETIGDAYMVASGVPIPSKNHVRNIAAIALMDREFLEDYEIPHRPGQHLHCRWGFNSGPVYAGVVGFNAPRYCIFGHTVTIAAKMESSGVPDKIQLTLKSHQLLTARFPEFKCSPRGSVKLDGIGTLLTYWLDGVEELLMSDRSSYKRVISEEAKNLARAASRQAKEDLAPDRPSLSDEEEEEENENKNT